jgi:hypothetical protein
MQKVDDIAGLLWMRANAEKVPAHRYSGATRIIAAHRSRINPQSAVWSDGITIGPTVRTWRSDRRNLANHLRFLVSDLIRPLQTEYNLADGQEEPADVRVIAVRTNQVLQSCFNFELSPLSSGMMRSW